MSSVKGDYCNIEHFEPTSRTVDAIAEMNRIIQMSSLLERIIMAVPFFQIFAGRQSFYGVSTASAGYQITTSDWNTFADAVKGVNNIEKERLRYVATITELSAMGEERKFWECVRNAI
jgi:hypothetical protein